MRTSFVTLIGVLVFAFSSLCLVGCSGGDSAFVGKWELDKEAFKKAVEEQMSEEDEDNPMAGMAMAMAQSMDVKVEIKSDHTFTATMSMAMMGSDTTTGTWKREGNGIVMTSSDGNEGPGKLILKGGELHAEVEKGKDEPPLILKRQKS